MMLPTRPTIAPGQALDCYLEHLAGANQFETSELMSLLREHLPAGEPRFLTLAPSQATLDAISRLCGQPHNLLRAGTQSGLGDASPAGLTQLNHDHPVTSYRTVAAKGWLLGNGTQACPECLIETGQWQTRWMLYSTIGCTRHQRHLLATCPTCQQPLRNARHSPLRPQGTSSACQNPNETRGMHCLHNLATTPTPSLHATAAAYQHAHDQALTGYPAPLLGHTIGTRAWLAEHRALTTLICHIATHIATHSPPDSDWEQHLRSEANQRTNERGPRWGITPPTNPWIRGHALAEAHRILSCPTAASAADALQSWIMRIPTRTEALTAWIADRTTPSALVLRLADQAAATRRRPGRRVVDQRPAQPLRPDQIPWIVPETLAARYLPALPGVTNRTRNAYAALCLARQLPGITTWSQAAEALGLPPDSGKRTAKLCSAAMRTHGDRFTHGLQTLAAHLGVHHHHHAHEKSPA